MTKVSNQVKKTSYICVQFNPKNHTTMAHYRTTYKEIVRILETKDIATIDFASKWIDIITDDGIIYSFKYRAFSTFKRVFKVLFRLSIIIDMHKVCTFYLGGSKYRWTEFAPALLKSPNWLDFLCNLNPQEYIRYETQKF